MNAPVAPGVVVSPAFVLAALFVLCVLPAPLLAYWRHQALRAPADPERPAWFAFAIRVQLLGLASALGMPAIALRLPVRSALFQLGFHSTALLLAVPLVLLLLPTATHLVMAGLVAGDVERRLRGTSWGSRQRLRLMGHRMIVVLPIAAAIVLAPLAFASAGASAALATASAGLLATVYLASTRQQLLGMTLEAEAVGPLRDRVFALAERAGVPLRQVYVLSSRSARVANAFAVHGGKVLLTDHLLAHLTPDEVEAVVAHELAHLRASHPRKLQWALMGGGLLGMPFVFLPIGAWGLALSGLGGWFVYVAFARRFEFEADRAAAALLGSGESLVSALAKLARLGHLPIRWNRAIEWMLTHPSLERRARALVAAGQLDATRAPALLATPLAPAPVSAAEPDAQDRVFGSSARQRQSARLSWLGLLVSVIAPVAAVALLRAAPVAWPRAAVPLVAALAAFGAVLMAMSFASLSGYAGWERELRARRREPGGAFTGFAPGDDDMTYESYADFDLGFLTLDGDRLRYEGEVVRFTLARDRIAGIAVTRGMPGWLRTPRVAVDWRDDAGVVRRLSLRDARARRLGELPARAESLRATLDTWWRARAGASGSPDPESLPPVAERVSGTPLRALAAPATLVPIAVLTALLTTALSPVAGLALSPFAGPGALDVFVGAMLGWVSMRLPVWRARPARVGAPASDALDRAA